MVWVCKKHGEDCTTYVSRVVRELNQVKIKPTDKHLEGSDQEMLKLLVKWVD